MLRRISWLERRSWCVLWPNDPPEVYDAQANPPLQRAGIIRKMFQDSESVRRLWAVLFR
jgi:hypothetical protein